MGRFVGHSDGFNVGLDEGNVVGLVGAHVGLDVGLEVVSVGEVDGAKVGSQPVVHARRIFTSSRPTPSSTFASAVPMRAATVPASGVAALTMILSTTESAHPSSPGRVGHARRKEPRISTATAVDGACDGLVDGLCEGVRDGLVVGNPVGIDEGAGDGSEVGASVSDEATAIMHSMKSSTMSLRLAIAPMMESFPAPWWPVAHRQFSRNFQIFSLVGSCCPHQNAAASEKNLHQLRH